MGWEEDAVVNGEQPREREQQPQSQEGGWTDALHSGVTFGWADELGGFGSRLAGMAHGDTWDETAAAGESTTEGQRQDLAAYRNRNPWTAGGLELAGSVISGGPAMKLATGLKLPGLMAAGAAEGALGGAGAADQNKIGGAFVGGLLGGTVAGVLPGALTLGKKGYDLIDRNIIDPIVSSVSKDPKATARILQQTFQDMTPTQIQARQRQLGPEATPYDLGGPRVVGVGQGVVGLSGDAAAQARKVAEARGKKQTGRMQENITEAFGERGRYLDNMDEINTRQKAGSRDAYDAAYQYEVVPDDELVGIMNRPAVRGAVKQSLADAANEGRRIPSIEKVIMQGDDVRFTRENIPDMKSLDYMKKALDRKVNAAASPNSLTHKDFHGLKTARNALKEKLDNINPAYKKARDLYAGDASLKDAMEVGEKVLTHKTREVRAALRDLNPSEKEAYINGAVEAIQEKMGRARAGSATEFNFLENNNVKDKLRMLFPEGREGDRQAARLFRKISRERTFAVNEADIIGGAQTGPRRAGERLITGKASEVSPVDIAVDPTGGIVAAVTSKAKELLTGHSQKTIDELGSILFKPNNAEELLSYLKQKGIPETKIRETMMEFAKYPSYAAPGSGLMGVGYSETE